jgi:hypothetical protein
MGWQLLIRLWLKTYGESLLKPVQTVLKSQGWEVGIMSQPAAVSAFDCDIIRSAFIKSVIEDNIPEAKWRTVAADLISDFTDSDDVDPELVDWIVRK